MHADNLRGDGALCLKRKIMEFDHLFICVDKPAREAEQLIAFGLTEGTSNCHPGQGTENRRFFFQNSFIELLFVADHDELNSDLTKPTKLHERFPLRAANVSPFGVCFRPTTERSDVPFPSWSYQPQYLPEHLDVKVAQSPSSEPMWFYLSFGSRPDSASNDKRQALMHDCGFKHITSIKVSAPLIESLSEPAIAINNLPGVEFVDEQEHLLSIGFDGEAQGKARDFRPSLPLIFQW